MSVEYNTDLFREDRIVRMLSHFTELLQSALAAPETLIGKLNLLPVAERELLLHTFNDTAADYPAAATLVSLFEGQAARTPDHTAVTYADRVLSYQTLNEQSNRLAHYLRHTCGIQPDDVVALQLDRSEWMVTAILGVLKSGAAYLPIGPDLPAARVSYMLTDSRAKALLLDGHSGSRAGDYRALLPELVTGVVEEIAIDNQWSKDNPALINSSADLAYILYTSGSTGQPKGVMVSHGSFVNFREHYGLERHVSSLTTSYVFDVSVMEIWTTLLSSGRLVIPRAEEVLDPAAYAGFLYRHEVSHAYLHPFTLEVMGEELAKYPSMHLRRLLVGVDATTLSF